MFPLKRRRKFTRVYKKGLTVTVDFDGKSYDAMLKDISASGCKLIIKDKNVIINLNSIVKINFTLNERDFSIEATKVRESGFNFNFSDKTTQSLLNNEILNEYFRDMPELKPTVKK